MMQTQSHKDVVKNITSASQLEAELQLSQAQHGVAVLDIYNAEWGNCKALSETFRRLSTDASDLVHLRFFSVECKSVLKSLHGPEDSRVPPRPQGMDFSPETLSTFWSKMLSQRQNHSKPYFAFYKEGKMRTHLEGIDTPKICRIVHDLCKQQNAAAEYITNPDVLRFWESHFSPSESEVDTNEFIPAVRALLGADAADMSGDDLAHIAAAVRGGDGGIVTASNLQSFVGDSGTLKTALLTVVAERRAVAAKAKEEATLAAAPRVPSPKHEEEAHEAVESAVQAEEDGEGPREEVGVPAETAVETPADQPPSPPAPETATEVVEEAAVETPAGQPPSPPAPETATEVVEEAAVETPADQPPSPPAPETATEMVEETAAQQQDEVPESKPEADDKDAYEELDRPEEKHAEELESSAKADAVAVSTIAESSASPPSVPEGVSAEEHDREVELAPSNELDVPQEPAAAAEELSPSNPPTPVSSPPHSTAEENGEVKGKEGASAEQEETTINQIFTNRWVTVSEEEMHVWNTVAALPLHYPESTTLMADLTNDESAARDALPASPETFPTLAEYLDAQGVPFADVNMMCIAADQKVGSESLSYGKLSLILMSCDSEVGKGLIPDCEQFLSELSAGTLLKQHQPLAFTALALSASEAYPDESFYYCLPEGAAAAFQGLSENDIFILNALTPLNTAVPPEGVFVLRIIGLPKVIELATTDESDDTMVLSQWFARLRVVEQGADATTVHFVENVCDEEFQSFLDGYIARLIEDENRLDKKQGEAVGESIEEAMQDGAVPEDANEL